MTSTPVYALLVGAHFRPPATPILSVLKTGTRLEVRPEPENPYDPQAQAVWITTEEITRQIDLQSAAGQDFLRGLSGCGQSIETLSGEAEWQLGYLAREGNKDLEKKKEASPNGRLASAAEISKEPTLGALFWGPNGEALVKIAGPTAIA